MRKSTYSKILMAPLLMLLAVACAPNQFNQSSEYDDVYFTSADRKAAPAKQTTTARAAQLQSQSQAATLEDYSSGKVDEKIVTKYNNGTEPPVTYFEEGPIVKRAADLNYNDFLADYNNQQLAKYDLPLDWETDWDRVAFDNVMQQDFQFSLAWYDHYYRGQSLRMEQYLNGSFAGVSRRARIGRPAIGLYAGFNNVNVGFVNMAFVDINPWGFYDPFWSPISFRRNRWGFGWRNTWAGGWGWNSWAWNGGWGWNDPFFCPPGAGFGFNGFGWRNGWRNNVFVNNNIIIDRRNQGIIVADRRDVRRGPRVSTSRISTVRNDAINGTAPSTRSSRYVDNLDGDRANVRSRSGRANSGTSSRTNSVVDRSSRSAITNGRSNRVRTNAYRFEDSRRGTRSNDVRNYGSTSRTGRSSQTRAITGRQDSRSSYGTVRSSGRSNSNPSFNRNSSSRSYGNSRTSRGYNDSYGSSRGSSRNAYSRGSSSRSSYSNGRSSGSRSSYSRGSSSRSSGSRSSYSRGSSSRSSGSISRGSSRGSSRSSGSISRGSSSRSSGSRSSSSSRSSSRSSSSRSGRGN